MGTKGDAKDVELLHKIVFDHKIEIFVASAAIIGGISMFHKLAYFLLAENERITCAAFDTCVEAHKAGFFEKIVVISSSMVYECTDTYPSKETDLKSYPPDGPPFKHTSDDPFEYDVQLRVPCVEKVTKVLGVECKTSLETALDEVIPWIKEQI